MATDLTTLAYWDQAHSEVKRPRTSWLRQVARRRMDALMRKFADLAPPQGAWLELGCSPGRMLERVHRVAPGLELGGIEYVPSGVKKTRNYLNEAGIHATIQVGDLRTVELSELFDVVSSFGLIEHFEQPEEILSHHARFCRPGGVIAVTVPSYAQTVTRRLIEWFDPKALRRHNLSIMCPSALHDALERAGLRDIRTGYWGAPRVRAASDSNRWFATTYSRIATMWNTSVSLVPFDFLWHSIVWGTGRVPA